MTQAAVGFSAAADPSRAVEEAVGQARERLGGATPDWCIAFLTSDYRGHTPVVLARLSYLAGTPYVAGCSAAGVLTDEHESEGGPALGVLLVRSDSLRATPFLFDGDDERGYDTGQRIGERFATSREADDLVMVWPDPYHVRPDRLLRGLGDALDGVPVAGAAAAGTDPEHGTFQFSGEDCRARAVSGIRLGGGFRYRVVVSQGCRPLGAPVRITACHENLIMEINGRPAMDVLRERAPDGVLDDRDTAFDHLFVGLAPGRDVDAARAGDYLVRSIVAADPDTGVLAIGDVVDEGQPIVFAIREGAAARDDLTRSIARMRSEHGPIDARFALYFNCLARGRGLYGEDGVDSRILREAFPGVPILGFSCNAEMAPLLGENHLFTYTGVLVLIGD